MYQVPEQISTPQIIFQDQDLMIIDKPSGMVINDSQTAMARQTLQGWLTKFDYEISKDNLLRSGIVHRLDKETSGIVIVAKNASCFYNLQDQFKSRLVSKNYIALAHGELDQSVGVIKEAVGRLPWGRGKFGVMIDGRDAITHYKVLKIFTRDSDKYSLLELEPKTGRTHQIRIHLKHIGHPIVADAFYAGRKTSKRDRQWCPRLFLHAYKISFIHPVSKKKLTFMANLPVDLQEVQNQLSLN